MESQHPFTVAIVQHPPVFMDRVATLQRATELVAEAAANGARLVVFPEAFVPGFPVWIWSLAPGDYRTNAQLYGRLVEQAVDLAGHHLQPLFEAARACGVTVVCGISEREGLYSGTTLYNTSVIIGPDGRLLNRHRKMVPTNAERMVWAPGDAIGLRTVGTAVGKVSTLTCWENFMPLARFALYAQGVEIYIAPTYDSGDKWLTSMAHIGFEGRCWVLGSGNALTVDDIPVDTPGREQIVAGIDHWLNDGDSVVVDPIGQIIAGPLRQQTGILYADCDPMSVKRARYMLDVAGHYGRPDIFQMQVHRTASEPLTFTGGDAAVMEPGYPTADERRGKVGIPSLAD